MNVFADTWRGLVRRRLWPLAVVLVAALAATPFVLAKQPAATAAPAVAAASKPGDDAAAASFVSLADEPTADTATRRRVLGGEKDPFAPKPVSKAEKKKAAATATPAAPADSTPPSSAPPTGSAPPTSTPPTTTSPPVPTHPKYSIKVRFGKTDADLATTVLERLQPLPSRESPVLVYEGVENGTKVAIFSIPGSVTAQGDGKCNPSPQNCETLKLSAGDTEFITVTDTGDAAVDAQYQLDLVKIYKSTTTDTGAEADPSAAASTQQQRKRLKGYRFDTATGTLQRVKHTSRRAGL
jgi:hypothetical protein